MGPWPVLILLCVLIGGFTPPHRPAHFILQPVSSVLGVQRVSVLGGNSLRDTRDWGSGLICFLLLSINGLSESSIVSFESRLGELVPKSC